MLKLPSICNFIIERRRNALFRGTVELTFCLSKRTFLFSNFSKTFINLFAYCFAMSRMIQTVKVRTSRKNKSKRKTRIRGVRLNLDEGKRTDEIVAKESG